MKLILNREQRRRGQLEIVFVCLFVTDSNYVAQAILGLQACAIVPSEIWVF